MTLAEFKLQRLQELLADQEILLQKITLTADQLHKELRGIRDHLPQVSSDTN